MRAFHRRLSPATGPPPRPSEALRQAILPTLAGNSRHPFHLGQLASPSEESVASRIGIPGRAHGVGPARPSPWLMLAKNSVLR